MVAGVCVYSSCLQVLNLLMQRLVSSSDWSTCQLSPNAVCGSGIKTRMLDCVRSDGKSVDIKFCEEVRLWAPSVSVFSSLHWTRSFFLMV